MLYEVITHLGNNSHNNTNSLNTTNNQFNIQMFLNEHCKNAMNLTDFIQSLPITAETYDSTIENGLTKTMTNMLLNGRITSYNVCYTKLLRTGMYLRQNQRRLGKESWRSRLAAQVQR